MAESKYSATIKNLFQEYYKRNLSMGEYRAQRKIIIDQMDEEFNGEKSMHDNDTPTDQREH
jgi:hypothetical protein